MIKSWSYTRLIDFESCPFKAKLKYLDRIPDPSPRPAADRGTMIHGYAEDYVRGIAPFKTELTKFHSEFKVLREAFDKGAVSLEGEWGFDKDWKVVDWKKAWARIKLDANVHLSPIHAAVIDYKTGKKFGNEIKHGEQLQLYSLATFLRNPKVQNVTAELWYLDIDDLTQFKVSRDIALSRYLKLYDKRGRKMTEATTFPKHANKFSCKWCPYKPAPHGTGDCPAGVCE